MSGGVLLAVPLASAAAPVSEDEVDCSPPPLDEQCDVDSRPDAVAAAADDCSDRDIVSAASGDTDRASAE